MAKSCSCDNCGREVRVKYLKRGLCKECNREDDDVEIDVHVEVSTPAEDHDFAYNGEELPDVDFD